METERQEITRRSVLGIAASVIAVPRAVAQSLPLVVGPSDYVAHASVGARKIDMRVFLNVPPAGTRDRPILFVMHGVNRDADRYRDDWKWLSDKYEIVIVVPEFSAANFPGRDNYNFGGVLDRDGRARPRRDWNFQLIDQVFADFLKRSGSVQRSYDLYGHSAGAQFAHRFALLGGSPRVRRVVMANAGSYSMPLFDKPFPWGLGGIGLSEAHLTRVISLEGIVMLGDQDTDPNHPALPRDPEAMEQGATRFERGTRFFETLDAAARKRPFRFAWHKVVVPDVGHDNAGMAIAAAELLYGARRE